VFVQKKVGIIPGFREKVAVAVGDLWIVCIYCTGAQ